MSPFPALLSSFCELSLTTGGHRVRIADLSTIHLTVNATEGFASIGNRVAVDANGYELFNVEIAPGQSCAAIGFPNDVADSLRSRKWITVADNIERNLLFVPPNPSGRYLPLIRLPAN